MNRVHLVKLFLFIIDAFFRMIIESFNKNHVPQPLIDALRSCFPIVHKVIIFAIAIMFMLTFRHSPGVNNMK